MTNSKQIEAAIELVYKHCLEVDVHDIHPDESVDFNDGYCTALEDLMNSSGFRKALQSAQTEPAQVVDIGSLKKDCSDFMYEAICRIGSKDEPYRLGLLIDWLNHEGHLSPTPRNPHIEEFDIDYIIRSFIKIAEGDTWIGDHGCIQCFPSSELADGNFTCSYHQAKAYAANMEEK